MDCQAEMDSVEFYKTKSGLARGTYKIIEHDGEVNYCELNGYGKETWRSEREQEDCWQELKLELNFESNMRDMDEWYDGSFDPDHAKALELSDDDCNDCGQCPTCYGEMSADCSARSLDNGKSLADILREAVQR